ncbi:MAG: hypothetical protein PCFJNLEI_03084 [Verrucomicrobiae bacterium]|nr:hypothetical protein [Verrucomicrobiae bacterium]
MELLICLLAVGWMMQPRAMAPVFEVPRLTSAAQALEIQLTPPSAGKAWLGWNESNLLVRVEVPAARFTEAADLDKLWQRDSVELYLAPRVGARDLCQWVIAPGMDPKYPTPRVHFHNHRRTPSLKSLPAEATVTRTRTETGYRLEARLPWTSLGIKAVQGREVGVQIMVNTWGDTLQHAVWFPEIGAASDYRKLHRVRLATRAHVPRSQTVQLGKDFISRLMTFDAIAQLSRRQTKLQWSPDGDPGNVTISRRELGGKWKQLAAVAGNEFLDTGVGPGRISEYALQRGGEYSKWDYFWAARELPARDDRGTVLLLVDATHAGGLAGEIARLRDDLAGDGWRVVRRDVARSASVAAVKELIRVEKPDSALLLGHIPVPYFGNLNPDGHADHKGAWPADVYYGDLTGDWSDNPSRIPGAVEVAIGRVDFANMPAFAETEQQLLKRYLDRNHAYRHKQLVVPARALVLDGFPTSPPDMFAYTAWQNFTTTLGAEAVEPGNPFADAQWRLWTFACGPGGYQHLSGLGTTQTFVEKPFRSIFALFMGSYFGDWNTTNNFMRAALANADGALAAGWAGRPHWFLHPMAFGETIGACLRLTQNNGRDYQPVGYGGRGVHIALLGDPTLRQDVVAPPTNLKVKAGLLTWKAAAEPVLGYYVYRDGNRLTPKPIAGGRFKDAQPGRCYSVRAVKLQRTPTGSYYNLSQAAVSD